MLIGTFLGGLGLFLLGVGMITDGLRMAAGNSLRRILVNATSTPLRGLASGMALTALVQSSSAITIATIGFVNAGLLGLTEALAVVLGSSVGTTFTGWLVALVGLEFDLSSIALPMVGAGMLMRLVGSSRRAGAVGEAIAGFGLFFIGIDFLRDAFESSAMSFDFSELAGGELLGPVLFLLAGILLTVMTQSSSAAIAITLTSLGGDAVPFSGAAAMIAGATIGTTSTSALAVIGATANAKRVAAGHVLVNSINGLLGLLLLPVLLWLVETESLPAGLSEVTILVLYHTSFNLLGAILQGAVLSRISGFLSRRFRSEVEDISRPEYLDRNILASPALAINAFLLELQRMAELSRDFVRKAVMTDDGQSADELETRHDSLRQLVLVVEQNVSALEAGRLSKDIVSKLPHILRISNYLDEIVSQAFSFCQQEADLMFLQRTPVNDSVAAFRQAVLTHVDRSDPLHAEYDRAKLEQEYEELRQQWRDLKTEMLNAGVNNHLPMDSLNTAIDTLRNLLRVAERFTRCASRLDELAV